MPLMRATDDRVLETQAAVLRTAVPSGVRVSFGEGRRRSDLTLALLKGERLAVLSVAPRMCEAMPVDLEIVRCSQVGAKYELMVAITERLEHQTLRAPERRTKLLSLAAGTPDAETGLLLEGG